MTDSAPGGHNLKIPQNFHLFKKLASALGHPLFLAQERFFDQQKQTFLHLLNFPRSGEVKQS